MALTDPGIDRGIWKARPSSSLNKAALGEACKVGDVLGKDSNGEWKRALASVGAVIQGKAVALADGDTGETVDISENAVVVGYSGGTPGSFVYVAEVSGTGDGKITETAPTDAGDANTIIGVVLTASVVVFFLGARPESLAT